MSKPDPTATALLSMAEDPRLIPNMVARAELVLREHPEDPALRYFLPAFARARELLRRGGVYLDAMTKQEIKVDNDGLIASIDAAERRVISALALQGGHQP